VVLNPVRAGLAQRPEQGPWSSYKTTVSEGRRASFLETGRILFQFGDERRGTIRRYKEFVLEGVRG